MIKKYFLTGLAILLPVALTFFIVSFLIKLVTKPFMNITYAFFERYELFQEPFFFLTSDQVTTFMSEVTVIFFLIIIILFVGFLGRLFLFRYLGYLGDYIFHRLPLINKIYKAIQEVVTVLFSPSKTSFSTSSVALVPFPHKGMRSIGLITNGELPLESNVSDEPRLSVFVPGTPNPAMGFMLMFRKRDITPLNMSVDEALKFLVSCGVIFPEISSEEETVIQQDISGD